MFHVQDDSNWLWWNLGGWGNSRHAIEQCIDGGKTILGRDTPGQIETGRWYDIRIELNGSDVRCFLDGKLVHQASDIKQLVPLHAVASRAKARGELILKVVNATNVDYDTEVNLRGIKKVRSGTATTLTSPSPTDENSLAQPRKVAPAQQTLRNAAPQFRYTFPANSLTVLRLHAL